MALAPATRILLQRSIQRATLVVQDVLLDARFPPGDFVEPTEEFSVDVVPEEPVFEVDDDELESVILGSVASISAAVESLIWHEMVIAMLMDDSAHFEGFGQFEYDSEREIVRFKASSVISALERPEIEPDETELGDAIAFCNREVRNPEFVEMSWESAVQEPRRMDLAVLYATTLVRRAITKRRPRSLSAIAVILAATAYFSWLIAFAITLRDASTVTIADIGTFRVDLDIVDLDLAPELIDLLAANTRVH
jgi:hypothetical protein